MLAEIEKNKFGQVWTSLNKIGLVWTILKNIYKKTIL